MFAKNLVSQQRSKQIDVKYHFICSQIESENIQFHSDNRKYLGYIYKTRKRIKTYSFKSLLLGGL